MNKSLLVTRPNHDTTTNYFCQWSEKVIRIAKERSFKVYDLKGEKAKREVFQNYLRGQKPRILFLNGHGNSNAMAGQDNEPLLESSKGETNVVDTIIYARSCDAAQVLGRKLVEEGASAFIGYTNKFVFGYTPEKVTKPLEDSLAELFLEPSNLVVTTLIKGHTAVNAHSRSLRAMQKNFRKMISSAASYEERYAARWLWGNIKSQAIYGNGNSSIADIE